MIEYLLKICKILYKYSTAKNENTKKYLEYEYFYILGLKEQEIAINDICFVCLQNIYLVEDILICINCMHYHIYQKK